MGTPAFPELGRHCSLSGCGIVDFLPFECDLCSQVFCLEHRSYSSHNCVNVNRSDVTVMVCPLCAKSIKLNPNEDPNLTWETHTRVDCNPDNYDKVTKKPRCPTPGCKQVLTFSNKFKCKECLQEVCLKHRFGSDHKCPGPKYSKSSSTFSRMFGYGPKETMPNSKPSSSNSQSLSLKSGLLTAASNLKASAEASFLKLSNAMSSVSENDKKQLTEECPSCGLRFSSVVSLVDHVEKIHENGSKPGTSELPDMCPKCGQCFNDAVSLVSHIEKIHGGTSFS